jgi:hypothetical protein
MNESFWKRFPPIPGFDCVKMKHEIQAKIYKEIKDMSQEEQIAYFNRAGSRFRRRYRQAAQHDAPILVKEAPGAYGKKTPRGKG